MSRVQTAISQFIPEFEKAVRADALDQLTAALGGRSEKKLAPLTTAVVNIATPEKPKKRKRGKGAKRTPAELSATQNAIKASLASASKKGLSAEEIQKALKVDLATIQLPITKLLEAKLIKKTGNKRATRYFHK